MKPERIISQKPALVSKRKKQLFSCPLPLRKNGPLRQNSRLSTRRKKEWGPTLQGVNGNTIVTYQGLTCRVRMLKKRDKVWSLVEVRRVVENGNLR